MTHSHTSSQLQGTNGPAAAGSEPSLAVVVASNRNPALLRACLAALVPQCAEGKATLIVVRAGADGAPELLTSLRAEFPIAIFLAMPGEADIPRLRGAGLAAACAALVALTEDHCVPAADWVARITAHLTDSADVVGGGMNNLRPRMVDWGAYFSEYGFFDATRPDSCSVADGVPLLTGANIAYRGAVRELVATWMSAGEWENVVHRRLAEAGHRLVFDRTMQVAQNQTYRFFAFCADRYVHGLDYARTRSAGSTRRERTTRAVITPLLPVVLTWRVATSAGGARAKAFVRALPATVAFLTAWSLGEAVGYVRGRAS